MFHILGQHASVTDTADVECLRRLSDGRNTHEMFKHAEIAAVLVALRHTHQRTSLSLPLDKRGV